MNSNKVILDNTENSAVVFAVALESLHTFVAPAQPIYDLKEAEVQ